MGEIACKNPLTCEKSGSCAQNFAFRPKTLRFNLFRGKFRQISLRVPPLLHLRFRSPTIRRIAHPTTASSQEITLIGRPAADPAARDHQIPPLPVNFFGVAPGLVLESEWCIFCRARRRTMARQSPIPLRVFLLDRRHYIMTLPVVNATVFSSGLKPRALRLELNIRPLAPV